MSWILGIHLMFLRAGNEQLEEMSYYMINYRGTTVWRMYYRSTQDIGKMSTIAMFTVSLLNVTTKREVCTSCNEYLHNSLMSIVYTKIPPKAQEWI